MFVQPGELTPGAHFPQPDYFIFTRRGEHRAVRRHREDEVTGFVIRENNGWFVRADLIDFHASTAPQHPFPIGRETTGISTGARHRLYILRLPGIPDFHSLIPARSGDTPAARV